MIILKGILIFLIILSLQNGVKTNLFDFTDIKSIKNFIRDSYNISKTNFESFHNLTLEEKNATAGKIFQTAQSLIDKITALRPEDESSDDFWWSRYVLAKLKLRKIESFIELFELNGKIITESKHVSYDKRKISTRWAIYTQNTQHVNYCLHAWGMRELALYEEFNYGIDHGQSHGMHVDNVRQLFLDLVYILSRDQLKDENRYDFCDRSSSFNLGLFNLYKKILITAFEGFTVQYFAWMGRAICLPEIRWYKHSLLQWEDKFVESWKMIMDYTIKAINDTEYYMFNCHQKNSQKDFFAKYRRTTKDDLDAQLGGMMQTIIISEQNLTTTQSCSHNCHLDLIKDTLTNEECDEFLDCQYVSSSYEIHHLVNSSRRYGHLIGDNGTEYGDKNRYSSKWLKKSQVNSTYNDKNDSCDYCACTCVKKQPTSSPEIITALNFRPQLSDIENNKVVTGLLFFKQDHMIQVQIEEGQILSYGQIANESWKAFEKFEYNQTTKDFYVINADGSKVRFEEGVDCGNPRMINLNNAIAPKKHVVTGVRFRFAEDSHDSPKLKKGPIELQIRVTPLDFVKGQLININQSIWISPKEKVLKDELVLENPDNPLHSPENGDPIVTSNKFVKFGVSDFKKDAGQSTVPFFENRQVTFYKRCPLSGVGLIHRAHSGSGGYIDWKIFDFDMSPYFNSAA